MATSCSQSSLFTPTYHPLYKKKKAWCFDTYIRKAGYTKKPLVATRMYLISQQHGEWPPLHIGVKLRVRLHIENCLGSHQHMDVTCSFVVDEIRSPKDSEQRSNDLGPRINTNEEMSRGKACKGSGEEPVKEIGNKPGDFGS